MSNFFKRFAGCKKNVSENRNVIIHNHLFKNAGSTIDWSLNRNFKHEFVDHRDDQKMLCGAEYLGQYLAEFQDIKALSTHHLVLPLPKLESVNIMMITMFRHPIERVRSVYKFERKQVRSSTPGAIHARKYNLQEYVEWRMQPDVGETIRNFHTMKCLPKKKYIPSKGITESNFPIAVQTVQETEMLGLVERFDESIVCFEEYLKPFFPEIDLSYRMQNVGQSKKTTREERINSLRSDLGEETFQKLLEHNKWDLKLYEIVSDELSGRISQISNFSQKLEEFKKRCQALQD